MTQNHKVTSESWPRGVDIHKGGHGVSRKWTYVYIREGKSKIPENRRRLLWMTPWWVGGGLSRFVIQCTRSFTVHHTPINQPTNPVLSFLPRDAMLVRDMLRPCLSVCLSVTNRCSLRTTKHAITQTQPSVSDAKDFDEIPTRSPQTHHCTASSRHMVLHLWSLSLVQHQLTTSSSLRTTDRSFRCASSCH